jgi:hypothetical protein
MAKRSKTHSGASRREDAEPRRREIETQAEIRTGADAVEGRNAFLESGADRARLRYLRCRVAVNIMSLSKCY